MGEKVARPRNLVYRVSRWNRPTRSAQWLRP